MLVDLIVVSPSPRELVVIDDPIPAGLEAVDTTLSTTASWLSVPSQGGEPGSHDSSDGDWDDDVAHGSAFLNTWVPPRAAG